MQNMWSHCTRGSGGQLTAPLHCRILWKKNLFSQPVSRMVGALGHTLPSLPSLTSVWCLLTGELRVWRHSAGACLSASLDRSRQVDITDTCLLVRRWHDGYGPHVRLALASNCWLFRAAVLEGIKWARMASWHMADTWPHVQFIYGHTYMHTDTHINPKSPKIYVHIGRSCTVEFMSCVKCISHAEMLRSFYIYPVCFETCTAPSVCCICMFRYILTYRCSIQM